MCVSIDTDTITAAIGVMVALVALIVARSYYLRTLIGKQHDRLLELNRLTIQHPAVAKIYFEEKKSSGYLETPQYERTSDFYAVRAYVLFRLNVYEEVFYATQGPFASRSKNGKAWQAYVKEGLSHPLTEKLFNDRKDQFGAKFVRFIELRKLPVFWGR